MARHKDPIHGFIYQLKLLILFLHRGIGCEYDFILRTEMEDAGSFDDLFFEYKEGNKKFYRLLQAKHSLDESKKITTAYLLAGMGRDQKYSLIKYYNSYMKCKNQKLFKKGSFKDLIICTNIDLDAADLTKNDILVHPITKEDDILSINVSGGKKKPMRYSFDESLAFKLKPELEKNYDSTIVKDLVDYILHNKPLHKKKFGVYENALVSDVIDKQKKVLHESFVLNRNLSPRVSEFRVMFEYELQKKSNNELNLITLNQELVKGERFKLIIPQAFGQNLKNKPQEWPQNILEDKDDSDSSIAEMLVSFILSGKLLHKKEFGIYGNVLFSYVIDKKNKTLQEKFVSNKNLSSRESEFRVTLENELQKQSDNTYNLTTLNEELIKGEIIKLRIPQEIEQNPNRKQNLWPQKNIENKHDSDSSIAEMLVSRILANELLDETNFRIYQNALYSDVIDKKSKSLHENFVSNKNLSSRVSDFRVMFENELQKQSDNKLDLTTLNEELINGENIKLNISQAFRQNPKEKQKQLPQKLIENKEDSVSSVAIDLVSLILNNNPIIKNQFGTYVNTLFSKVIDIEHKILHENFVSNKNLPSRVSKFRDKFEDELRRQSNNELNLITLNEALVNGEEIKLNIQQEHEQKTNEKDNLWPRKVIENKDVLEFLRLLIFAVNQINEDELGKAIKNEIGDHFNKITSESIYKSLFHHMVDFLQGKQHAGKSELKFWSYDEGKNFIRDTCFEIIHLQLSGCRDHLDSIKCCFKETYSHKVQDFFGSTKPLWILTSESPYLSTLAIYRSIRNNGYNKNLFVYRWSDLLDNNGKILNYFKGLDECLIIVSCLQMIGTKNVTAELIKTFEQLLFQQKRKSIKIIVIASERHELRRQLLLKQQDHYSEMLNICFGDMDEQSQMYLLEKENIHFQGKRHVSLQKLLEISYQKTPQQIENLLDASAIELLYRNSSIKIFDQTDDFNSITYKPNKYLNFNNIKNEITLNTCDIFAFYGEDEEIKMFFHRYLIELVRFNITDELKLFTHHRLILLEQERHATDFNALCKIVNAYPYGNDERSKPALHKLKYIGNDKWIWMETFEPHFYINRCYYPNVIGRRILKLLADPNFSECIFFSGLTKKEILTEIYNYYDDKNIEYDPYIVQGNCVIASSAETATEEFNFLSKTGGESSFHNMNDSVLRELREILNSNKNIFHWIELQKVEDLSGVETLRLEWRQSSGNIMTVKNRRNLDKNFTPEETLIRLDKRITLLADAPGTGKSSTLTRVIQTFKKNKPNSLVVEINLSKLQRSVVSFYVNSNEQLINMLFRVLKKSDVHIIERKIMDYKLNHQEQLILLFDGFDEISTELQESALHLFKFIIAKTRAALWITTRLQNKEMLENYLNVLSYSFKPLSKLDQIAFLSHFWKVSFKFSGRDCSDLDFRTYAILVTQHFASISQTFEYSSFVENPLMLRSVAETYLPVFTDVLLKNCKNGHTIEQKIRKISLTNTFESLVRHVYDIYFLEKIKILEWFEESQAILRNAYSDAYRYLAVKHVCNNAQGNRATKLIISNLGKGKYLRNMTKELSLFTLSKIGLIQTCHSREMHSLSYRSLLLCDSHMYEFIHPAFAQCFTAEFICIELKNNPNSDLLWEFLIEKILFLPFSRRVFDDKLESDFGLASLSAGNKQKLIIYELLYRQVKENGAETLWRVAENELRRTISFLTQWRLNINYHSFPPKQFFNFKELYIGLDEANRVLHINTSVSTVYNNENDLIDYIIDHNEIHHKHINMPNFNPGVNNYCNLKAHAFIRNPFINFRYGQFNRAI